MKTRTDTAALNRFCNEVLSLIEIEETRVLTWGFVQGEIVLEDGELEAMIEAHEVLGAGYKANAYAERDVLDNLQRRQLIMRTPSGAYRSRFAEGVRLLYLLRQRFRENDWETAPRLVSDMRIHPQRRRYPLRDVSSEQVLQKLKAAGASSVFQDAIARLFTDDTGKLMSLSHFQERAILSQHETLKQSRNERAMVIGAGTGTGKTKAFYMPAFAYLTQSISRNNQPGVKILAIYPRIELLKDQLFEALSEARKIEGIASRSIIVGAYFGDTPDNAYDLRRDNNDEQRIKNWQRNSLGRIAPMLKCPNGHDLIWQYEDIEREIKANKKGEFGRFARLVCDSPRCNWEIGSHQLALTREQMNAKPPDVLFTTTEMLNRVLARTGEATLFGVGAQTPPRLLLLDEIHTYEGLSGAGTANLLRRWRYACGYGSRHPLSIVGLSATLQQPESFFSRLTGIPEYYVSYITPEPNEMMEEGMEYNLVLKGDPVSGTALLSTSVQTAMLLGRVLDPMNTLVSEGAYGQKIFAFADTLDVISRWFRIQNDAETEKTLSQYRNLPVYDAAHDAAGQDWRIAREIGHQLTTPLTLERTTSKDRGVNPNAALVIASPALEVGYNDLTVGAVIQHKAPRDMASFLQRKGRGGRKRDMRPWTVVITSAYGRDRWAFQHADELFTPLLPPLDLPVENEYVRKMQAAYIVMDWLAKKLKLSNSDLDVWTMLSRWGRGKKHSGARNDAHRLMQQVLDGTLTEDFTRYLAGALGVKPDDPSLYNVLWSEPRSLMLDLFPSLERQLATNWASVRADENSEELQTDKELESDSPLPEYVAANLFTDLNLPEVRLIIKDHLRKNEKPAQREDTLSLTRFFTEFPPGKANERDARRDFQKEARWLAIPVGTTTPTGTHISVRDFSKVIFDNQIRRVMINGQALEVYRPLVVTVEPLPEQVQPSSNAFMIWESAFEPHSVDGESGYPIPLADGSRWSKIITKMESFLQSNNAWVDVSRCGVGVSVNTIYEKHEQRRENIYFERVDGSREAFGFSMPVDALRLQFAPLDVQKLIALPQWALLRQSLMPAFLKYRLTNDSVIEQLNLTSFEIDWLWLLEMSMLVATALTIPGGRATLREAVDKVQGNRKPTAERVLKVIFQRERVKAEGEGNETLLERLLTLQENQALVTALRQHDEVLWTDVPDGFNEWLQLVYASSIGATVFASLIRFVPDISEESLSMDSEGDSIWISEMTAGGVGIIERLVQAIALRPREFELQLVDTIHHCDRENLATQLEHLASLVREKDPLLSQAFAQGRQQATLQSLHETRKLLVKALEGHGLPITRELVVALNARFLRPNSAGDSDDLLADLVKTWHDEEERLACQIDLRAMAVAAPRLPHIKEQVDNLLQRVGGEALQVDEAQKFNLFQSMLWLRCTDSCPDCIQHYFRYARFEQPSRHLLMAVLEGDNEPFDFDNDHWHSALETELVERGTARLRCHGEQLVTCIPALLESLVTPIDVGFQLFFPVIERIERSGQHWVITVILRELVGE